jgi:hypothetical protein
VLKLGYPAQLSKSTCPVHFRTPNSTKPNTHYPPHPHNPLTASPQ